MKEVCKGKLSKQHTEVGYNKTYYIKHLIYSLHGEFKRSYDVTVKLQYNIFNNRIKF